MTVRKDESTAAATVYCPVCWGAGRLYRIPPSVGGPAPTACGCTKPSVEDLEPYPCVRCAGTGLVAATPTPDSGTA